jgi:two-component system, cell cycle response regulator DivK
VTGARILTVEDTEQDLELMTYLLHASGHTVIAAMTGERGLELARLERPDLIVLDVQLPDIDRYQVLAQLRADRLLVVAPVVAVTAYAMVGDRDNALAAGFDAYLPKPIDPVSFGRDIDAQLPAALRGHAPTAQWNDATPDANRER